MENDLKSLVNALEDARHELVTLNGLVAYDAASPDERMVIDTRKTIAAIDEATKDKDSAGIQKTNG